MSTRNFSVSSGPVKWSFAPARACSAAMLLGLMFGRPGSFRQFHHKSIWLISGISQKLYSELRENNIRLRALMKREMNYPEERKWIEFKFLSAWGQIMITDFHVNFRWIVLKFITRFPSARWLTLSVILLFSLLTLSLESLRVAFNFFANF